MVKPTDRPVFACWTPLAFLVALALIYTVGLSVIEAHALIPTPAPEETQGLWMILFGLILTWWLYADRQVRRFSAPYEFETFAFFASPVVIPYYLYRTRRGRGLLLFFGVGGLFMTPYLVAAIIRVTVETRALR